MELKNFKKDLSAIAKKCDKEVEKILRIEGYQTLNGLKNLAPVDKGDFKKSWGNQILKTKDRIRLETFNEMIYGPVIESGCIPGNKPWPRVGPKTVLSNGKIYSSQAVDGTIERVFSAENINIIIKKIESAIEESFK